MIDPSRLYSALLNTGLQTKNNPLYQVIYNLIGLVINQQQINNTFISSGGGTVGPQGPQGIPGIPGFVFDRDWET